MTTAIYKSEAGRRAIETRYLELLGRWPVPKKIRRISTREGETFIVACGPIDAPPLLLLQGSGANTAMWMRDVAAWAEHFRIYAVDVIGEPGLSAPSRPPLASGRYTVWLDDVMNALGLESAALVGVSLGGWLALDYSTHNPERVDALVLINPSGVGRQKKSFLWKALPLLLLGSWGRRRALQMAAGGSTSTSAKPKDPAIAEFVGLIFRHFRPRRSTVPRTSDEVLARLTMPVLLIAGARDALLNAKETRTRLVRFASQLSVQFLAEGGHILPSQALPIKDFLLGVFERVLATRGHPATPTRADGSGEPSAPRRESAQVRLRDHHMHADVSINQLSDVEIRRH